MRREGDDHLATGGSAEFLIELGHMPVMADTISVKALRHFGELHLLLGGPARSGDAGFGVDHDLVGIDGVRFQQRHERKLRAGRVAARIGDEPRFLDLLPVDLDQAIDRLFLELRRMMGMTVPVCVGGRVGEPKIG